MRPLLATLALLLAGCSTTPKVKVMGDRALMENKQIKADFRAGVAQISIRRGEGWQPVAFIHGLDWWEIPSAVGEEELHIVTRNGSARFHLRGRQLLFESQREIAVEVVGQKTAALFPGLEFLEGEEFSSSDRDAHGALADRRRPEPHKITVPLMAYEANGALVALMWERVPYANAFFEAREANRMMLSLPHNAITFHGALHVEDGATIYDAVPRWTQTYGLPAPDQWPRALEDEIALCKIGFQTVSHPDGRYSHCVGWQPAWAPGFDVLRRLVGEKIDWAKYPDLLSSANCHILRWETPFYAGKPELVKDIVPAMKQLAAARVNGEWSFQPRDEKQATLGPRGATVLGTSAANAFLLAKAARMTGDADLKSAALESLRVLRKYRVPRGAQAWECPLYEPDILAAAYGVGANVEAFKLTGDKTFLDEAVRWAKSGLPFVYLWRLPDRAMMLYATIPVFGTSFHTHSWFGVPVQWNGLVYAYYLRKLAPLDRSFDWLAIADGITASAVHQQYADGPSKGCYPDSLVDEIRKRSPADINPEDILVNILTAIGHDPDPDLKLKPQEKP